MVFLARNIVDVDDFLPLVDRVPRLGNPIVGVGCNPRDGGCGVRVQDGQAIRAQLALRNHVVRVSHAAVELQPADGASALGLVLAQLLALAGAGRLDRLKICKSNECHWVFFDRSKPGNRRWCSSLLCGNRQKTREYRKRAKSDVQAK